MLNIAAPEKFVLTLQSIPPFLIESILAFALAVLLAVPLIARLQLLFDNRENCGKSPDPINPPGRRLNRRNRHIIIHYPSSMATTSRSSQSLQLHSTRANNSFCDMKQSLKTLTSGPLPDQSQDQPEDETEEEKAENDDETMSGDQILKFPYYEYQHYRHKLIKEHLKKNYGHFQAPGNVIFNSIHLSSIDSQRGIKYGDKHNHTLFNLVESLDANDMNCGNRYSKWPELRDYFLTKGINDKLETINRCTETVHSSIEVDKLPMIIGDKERANTPTGSSWKPRPLCAKKEKLSNDNTDSNNSVGSKIDTVDANSRPNSARKLIGKLFSRPGTPRSQLRSKKTVQPEVSIEFNSLTSNEHIEKTLDNSEQTQEQPSGFQNPSYTTEVPVTTAAAAEVVVEKPEKPPTHVSSVVGKCPSMASSEAFSSCSSKNPERRPINTRPGSSSGGGGGSSRAFRNLTSKVNSRPRSSGATFAWDKPNIPGKVPSYEEPTAPENITSNAKRPKSVNRKKSEVLSVLESIIDLSCDGTIDFQESTDDMVIKNFREMSDDIVSSKRMVHSSYPHRGGNSRVSANIRKPKTPVSPSNEKRTETSTNSKIDKKEFLRARSGIYPKWSAVGHSRR